MKKLTLFVFFLFFLLTTVNAATIHGTIYDLDLNKINGVILEVDSTPKQRLVSSNGEYSFNLPAGSYTITASAYFNNEENIAKETLIIETDGDYVLDLFLFPNLEDIDSLDFDVSSDLSEPKSNVWIYILIGVLILILIFILGFFKFKKKCIVKKEEPKQEDIKEEIESDELLEKVYDILKKEKRITQKELRKKINLSESKISLIISQLESEGKIKKIKKGRTNILIIQ